MDDLRDSLPGDLLEANSSLSDWSILLAYRGSIAHGTYEAGSIDDKDAIGICIPPVSYYYGLDQFGSQGTQEIVEGPWDIVVYELRKMMGLLLKGNPNVLSLLWLPPDLYMNITQAGMMLIEKRDWFATRSTFNSFVEYANAQLTKLERGAFKGYMGEKRKELVKKYGYDTKNAAHLIRLLRMGIEFLRDGELQVRREDAGELLAIKHGEWSMERVRSEAARLFAAAEEAHKKSKLPEYPDWEQVNLLTAEIVLAHFDVKWRTLIR